MIPIKQYIAKQFIKNTYHFTCDCLIPLDVIGTVKDYNINNNEIILINEINDIKEKSIKDIGIVMKEAKAEIGVAADGKMINEVVRKILK